MVRGDTGRCRSQAAAKELAGAAELPQNFAKMPNACLYKCAVYFSAGITSSDSTEWQQIKQVQHSQTKIATTTDFYE